MLHLHCVRCDAEDVNSAKALQEDGWRDVEVLETWMRPFQPMERIITGIRVATPHDLLACQAIAAHAFIFDRLHADPLVDKDVADQFKLDHVADGFARNVNDVFVAVSSHTNQIIGFLIAKPELSSVRIDLIAVGEGHRREGVATRLLGFMLDYYPGRQCVVAGTQEKNVQSRLFYQRRGFRIVRRERTFHKDVAGA